MGHTNPDYDDFKRFVESQPKNRPINHTSFYSCAIGNYVSEYLDTNPNALDLIDFADAVLPEPLFEALNEIGYTYSIRTYGDLQTLIGSRTYY